MIEKDNKGEVPLSCQYSHLTEHAIKLLQH